MYEIHLQEVCCRQRRVLWLYGVLTSVTSFLSDAIMHVEESCAIWCVYLLQRVHPTQPDVISCLSLFEIIKIQQLKANHVRNGLECSTATGASSMVSALKDRCVSELVSANSKFIVT